MDQDDLQIALRESLNDAEALALDLKTVSRQMNRYLEENEKQIKPSQIRDDGNCLLDCLRTLLGDGLDWDAELRRTLVDFVTENPTKFQGFPEFEGGGVPLSEVI